MDKDTDIIDRIIHDLVLQTDISTKDAFQQLCHAHYAEADVPAPFPTIAFIDRYRTLTAAGLYTADARVLRVLRKRAIRSLSGIAVISVLTKPYTCPGACIYCPTYTDLPKSYVPDEPAVMRAEMNAFDPVKQVWNRLYALGITGHAVDKCDIRIIGGTWSAYPREYREDFIKNLYDAHSVYEELSLHTEPEKTSGKFGAFKIQDNYSPTLSPTLEVAKIRNETAQSRVVGIAVETRPDVLTIEEIIHMRSCGITRVEIGYQSTDDTILTLNRRGHGRREIIAGTRLLKDAGLKVVAHVMPGLLGSTPDRDREVMREILTDPGFCPDELKIYPTVVVPHSRLATLWRNGDYIPYDDEILTSLIADLIAMIPEHVRLNRLYRDIPTSHILAGCRLANLRQVVETRLAETGRHAVDISSREIRARTNNPDHAILEETSYPASNGREYFLQWVDPVDRAVFSLLRLRIPSQIFTGEKHFIETLDGCGIIREVHTFGDHLRIGESTSVGAGQHRGFGRRLIERAETIVREQYPNIRRIAVTSGVGVRGYYARLGYHPEGEYMVKEL